MATRWWVAAADNDYDNASNWDTNEGGAGGAGFPTISDDAFFSDTSADSTCTLDGNESCANLSTRTDETSGTDNWSNTLTIDSNELDCNGGSGYFRMDGVDGSNKAVLSSNVSGVLVCDDFLMGQYSTLSQQSTSAYEVYGDCYFETDGIFSASARGFFKKLGSGTFDMNSSGPTPSNSWRYLLIDTGVTMTLSGSTHICKFRASDGVVINGTLALGAFNGDIHAFAVTDGPLTFGASSDITGSGELHIRMGNQGTYTNSKSGAFSLTGKIIMDAGSGWTNSLMITGDFSNADYELYQHNGGTLIYEGGVGTIKCKNFLGTYNGSYSITNSTNNTNFEISGNVDLNSAPGTFTAYTKGTGTITLTGSSGEQTISFDGKTVEDIIMNCSGATKEVDEAFTSDSLTMTAGTLELTNGSTTTFTAGWSGSGGTLVSDSSGSQASVDFSSAGSNWTGGTIKDIAINGGDGDKRLFAKGCTNNGNNDNRIIFNDSIGLGFIS